MPSFLDNLNAMNTSVMNFADGVRSAIGEFKTLGKTLEEIASNTEAFGGQPPIIVGALKLVNKAIATGKDGIEEQNRQLVEQIAHIEDIKGKTAIWNTYSDEVKQHYEDQLAMLENQKQKNAALLALRQKIGETNIRMGAVLYTLYKQTWESLRMMNEQLQAAAMTDSERARTNRAIFETTRNLGVPLASSAEAAKELANFGAEFYGDMEANLETVTMMKEGLGVSVDSAAELAAIVTRSLKVGFRDVADAIANTARDTGLSAQLAVKFATQISRAAMVFREGITKEMPKVIGYVTRLEGLLQEVGGVAGGVTELITRLTTVEGMVGAALLGIQTPEFMTTEGGAKQTMKGFADFAKQFLGDAGGWERTLRIEMLANMFGTTAQQVSAIVRAVDLDNQRLKTQSGLQRTFQEQMAATGKGWERLKNSLTAMLQEGLAPVMVVLNKVVGVLADFVGWLQKGHKWLPIVVVGVTAVIATVWVAYKAIMGLAAACTWLAASARAAAQSVVQQAVTGGVTPPGMGGGGGAGRGMGRLLGRLRGLGGRGMQFIIRNNFRTLASGLWQALVRFVPLVIKGIAGVLTSGAFLTGLGIAAAAALGVGLGSLLRLIPNFDNAIQAMLGTYKGAQKTAVYTKTNEEWMKAYVAKSAGEGMDPEAIAKVLRMRMQEEGLAPEVQSSKIANLLRWGAEQVGDIRYQAFARGHSLVPQDKVQQEKLLADQKRMADAADKAAGLAQKQIDIQKGIDDRQRKEDAEKGIWYRLWSVPKEFYFGGGKSKR